MLKRVFAAGIALVATAATAQAADVEAPAPYEWSGTYVGAHVGYGSADVDYDFKDLSLL